MLGRKQRGQLELFIAGSLRGLIPDDHALVGADKVLDLGWLRAELAVLYCADNGRPGIDPEVAVRLVLAGFLLGIVHDRRLVREASVNLAIRWFVGYARHEDLPDHFSPRSLKKHEDHNALLVAFLSFYERFGMEKHFVATLYTLPLCTAGSPWTRTSPSIPCSRGIPKTRPSLR